MKKLFFLTITALFLFTAANAQLFQYGIKTGVNFSSLTMEDVTGINSLEGTYDLITDDESVAGYQLGLMTRINVAMFFVQPELYFNKVGGVVIQDFVLTDVVETLNVNFSRMDIPILLGVKLGPASIKAGPVGSYIISNVNDLITLPESGVESLSNSFTWGYQAGIGIDLFKKLAIDLRYEGSLSRFGESFEIAGKPYNLDARPSSWIVGLGFWF